MCGDVFAPFFLRLFRFARATNKRIPLETKRNLEMPREDLKICFLKTTARCFCERRTWSNTEEEFLTHKKREFISSLRNKQLLMLLSGK